MFKNLKLTKVAGGLGRVGKKGLWHKMRPERWWGPHCAEFWVYPRSNRNAHSSLPLKYLNNTFWLLSSHSSNCNSQVIDLFPPLSCDILGDRDHTQILCTSPTLSTYPGPLITSVFAELKVHIWSISPPPKEHSRDSGLCQRARKREEPHNGW